MKLPASFRTSKMERIYQKAQREKTTIPLEYEPRLVEFQHWYIIENRYPGDAVFSLHHLLLPKRVLPEWDNLKRKEIKEFYQIRKHYLKKKYDILYENGEAGISVKNHFHFHLANRKER